MSSPMPDQGQPPTQLSTPRRRLLRVAAAVVLVFVLAATLLIALDTATLTYTLPPVPGSRTPNTHTKLWGPGVIASVVTALALLASLGWVVWNATRRTSVRQWIVAGVVTVLVVIITAAAGGIEAPTF